MKLKPTLKRKGRLLKVGSTINHRGKRYTIRAINWTARSVMLQNGKKKSTHQFLEIGAFPYSGNLPLAKADEVLKLYRNGVELRIGSEIAFRKENWAVEDIDFKAGKVRLCDDVGLGTMNVKFHTIGARVLTEPPAMEKVLQRMEQQAAVEENISDTMKIKLADEKQDNRPHKKAQKKIKYFSGRFNEDESATMADEAAFGYRGIDKIAEAGMTKTEQILDRWKTIADYTLEEVMAAVLWDYEIKHEFALEGNVSEFDAFVFVRRHLTDLLKEEDLSRVLIEHITALEEKEENEPKELYEQLGRQLHPDTLKLMHKVMGDCDGVTALLDWMESDEKAADAEESEE
jgi:hypothetical protein